MSHRNRLPLLLLLPAACVALFLAAPVARACSCGPRPTVLDAYEGADFVVVVRAVSVEKSEKAAPDGRIGGGEYYVDGVKSTTMRVERVYKGGLNVGDEMVFAQGGGGDCIWTFNEKSVGEQYLFYLASPRPGSKVWYGFGCGRSKGLESAADDLLYLNNLDKARGRTRISGTVYFDGPEGPDVAGRRLRIVGPQKTYVVKTDENGVYELYDAPPGRYYVEPEKPHGWRVNSYMLRTSASFAGRDDEEGPTRIPFVLEAKKHAGLDILFEIDNAVRGRVLDAEGRPMDGVCLELMQAGGKAPERFYKGDCTDNGGAFEIDEIPPGSYVIIVNDDGEVSSSEPFGAFYYPNVTKREEATVFHIAAGDFVEDLQIYPPASAETIRVEGLLLFADGKPVAGERVKFKAAAEEGKGGEKDDDDDEADADAETDAKGRFSIKILKGQRGELYGEMYTYSGEYENCPALEKIIKKLGASVPEVRTAPLQVRADANLYGVELRYTFPGCKKAP